MRCAKPALPVAAAACLLALTGACTGTSVIVTIVPAVDELQENVVLRESDWATRKIAMIDIDGVLRNSRSTSLIGTIGEQPVALLQEKLDAAAEDRAVRAVMLRINSPGGSVTASDLMYEQIRAFREKTGKPVIAHMMDVAASGGYYIACAADRITAQPTTVTGSIGVIAILPEISGTLRKIGANVNVIKSGAMKDAGSFFRTMNDEDRAVFQGLIDSMYGRFVDVVCASRTGLTRERVRELADGRVYYARAALEAGLIDEIGTLRDAIAAAKKAAGLEDRKVVVVQYARSHAYRPNIFAETPAAPAQVNLVNIQAPEWLSGSSPEFLYLWAPGW